MNETRKAEQPTVAELTGYQLDIAVAKALGYTVRFATGTESTWELFTPAGVLAGFGISELHAWYGVPDFSSSTDAAILLCQSSQNRVDFWFEQHLWRARVGFDTGVVEAETLPLAVCRAFLAAKQAEKAKQP